MILYEQVTNGILRRRDIDLSKNRNPKASKNGANNRRLEAKLDQLIQACNQAPSVIRLSTRASPSASFENCTQIAQVPIDTKGDSMMALHRNRVCIGRNDDGTSIIKQVSGQNELDLADNIVRAILASERRSEFVTTSGEPLQPTKMVPTFRDYTEEWLKTYKQGKKKATTMSGYRAILRSHLYPAFGESAVNAIATKDIQAFLDQRKEFAKKYLQEIRRLLAQILDSALLDGLITVNPARDARLTIPSDKKGERKALSVDEVKAIIASIDLLDEMARLYTAILVFTGMRRGEILGLKWSDIDLTDNVIHVVRNATYVNNQPIVSTPKTESGKRDVPIMPELLKYILPIGGTGFVIGSGQTPITLTSFRNMFKRIEQKVPLHDATSHTFRHTLGTLLNDAGADVKTIQGVLGHRDFKTTMDRYVHSIDARKQEAVEKVGEILSA